MAQRKPSTSAGRSTPAQKPARPATSAQATTKVSTAKPVTPPKAATPKAVPKPVRAAAPKAPASKGPTSTGPTIKGSATRANKKPKSIVNQRQTPWGTIAIAAVIAIFAVAIVGYAVSRPSKSAMSYLNALGDAKKISGVTFKKEPNRTHITSGTVNYDSTPPVGGNHSPYWADCTGTVYPAAIANENAVHDLEHGAVWITYNPSMSKADVATLAKYVTGIDHMVMSPYPDLKTPISLQAWGYQLFLSSPTDARIQQFIDTLKTNPATTPEVGGDCSQPTFKAHPSTFGHPLFAPAT